MAFHNLHTYRSSFKSIERLTASERKKRATRSSTYAAMARLHTMRNYKAWILRMYDIGDLDSNSRRGEPIQTALLHSLTKRHF
jgi:hypothetical protein